MKMTFARGLLTIQLVAIAITQDLGKTIYNANFLVVKIPPGGWR